MQRLFSMFAGGTAGIALLILRVCTCGFLLACAVGHAQFALPGWTLVGAAAIVLLLLVGVLTPVACVFGGLIEVYCMSHGAGPEVWQAVCAFMVFLALGLLGPGAFSLDARLFGRRLIVPNRD